MPDLSGLQSLPKETYSRGTTAALEIAQKEIERQQPEEDEALEEAALDLIRLERYERRTWSRQKRAICEFMNLRLMRHRATVAAPDS